MMKNSPSRTNAPDDARALEDLPAFLRRCRERLDPTILGLGGHRRRTPSLRREEVAQRANASVIWYTWLEQGREGTPSADMLDRLLRALLLSSDEREHLFLLAQQRPPAIERAPVEPSMAKLQAVLDSLRGAAAIIKNHRWDVLAWNEGALAVLTDHTAMPPEASACRPADAEILNVAANAVSLNHSRCSGIEATIRLAARSLLDLGSTATRRLPTGENFDIRK